MTVVVVLMLVGALLLAFVVAFLLRRRFLLMGLGAVTMWLRPAHSARWSVGVAWFGADSLLWYRALSLAVRPQRRLPRADVQVKGRRAVTSDDVALPSDVVVLTCETADGPQELALEPSTLTGFLSWLESAPPVH
jgi:Protein of unknown function (DUF2550)